MSTPLREFVVSYAFGVDTTSMARAESATKAAEDRIVAANAAAVAKRVAADQRAQRERIATIVKANGELSREDQRFVAEDLKRHQEAEAARRKIQDESFKRQRERFDEIAKSSRAFALNMAAVVTGAAAAIGAATGGFLSSTGRAAQQFERLHYMAQSSGASVRGLQAFSFAIAQLGGNADAAEAQVAEFGNKLKTFPQFEKNLQSMGIATRDAAGHMKDATEIAKDFFAVLAQKPRATQDALGEVYGFGEQTIRAGTRPGLAAFMIDERARRAQIGADTDLTGERGVAFERSSRRLMDDIESVKIRIETALMGLFKPALDTVAGWVEAHGKAISTTVIAIAKGISDVVSAFVNTGIVKDSIKALSDGLEEFAGYISSGDFKKTIKGFVSDLTQLAKTIRWALEKLGILTPGAGNPVVPEPTGSDDARRDSYMPLVRRAMHGRGSLSDDDVERGRERLGEMRRGGGGPTAIRGAQLKANAAAAADELRKAGAPDEGIAAVLGSMQTESSFDPRAHNDVTGGHTGLWQWDARRWPKVKAWIEKQGGDPWDARWQTKAYIAEGRAQAGDAIFDNDETSAGFQDVLNSKGNLGRAVTGVRRSERFGRGEEGGRAAHAARWLGNLPGSPGAAPAVAAAPSAPSGTISDAEAKKLQAWMWGLGTDHPLTQAEHDQMAGVQAKLDAYYASKPKTPMVSPSNLTGSAAKMGPEVQPGRARHLSDGDPVKVEVTDTSAAKIGKGFASTFPAGTVPRSANTLADIHANWQRWADGHGKALHHPGLSSREKTSLLGHSVSNVRGATHINHSPTYNVNTSDVKVGLDLAKRQGERGAADLIRNVQPVLA